ncbi:MAG: 5-formyltetrahydrofolate cyclo-ligase [Bacteroidales bacterium]
MSSNKTSVTIREEKIRIRKLLAERKKEYSFEWKLQASELIFSRLETTELFQQAECILLYHALPDEVQTASFISRWHTRKQILLPVVEGDHLLIRAYHPDTLIKGSYGIYEPAGQTITDLSKIDLAIIPGVGFDKYGNRLGRGKGYYDRLLPTLRTLRIGIGFSWQVIEQIPTESFDHPLDGVFTDNDFFLNI